VISAGQVLEARYSILEPQKIHKHTAVLEATCSQMGGNPTKDRMHWMQFEQSKTISDLAPLVFQV
jgi:hypothetical protein